jgi:hypothetical protein
VRKSTEISGERLLRTAIIPSPWYGSFPFSGVKAVPPEPKLNAVIKRRTYEENYGTPNYYDPSGHATLEFDKSDPNDIARAERRFRELVARGYTPAEQRGGGTHRVIEKSARQFNPNAEETIFIPALKGG